jgi:hypothetical protein
MVEIVYEPIKKLVIMEYTQYQKPEALATNLGIAIQAGQPAALLWSERIVFIPVALPPETDIIAQEYLKGNVQRSSVMFALLPAYQLTIKVGTLEVPVIDASPNSIMQELACWLKGRAKSN